MCVYFSNAENTAGLTFQNCFPSRHNNLLSHRDGIPKSSKCRGFIALLCVKSQNKFVCMRTNLFQGGFLFFDWKLQLPYIVLSTKLFVSSLRTVVYEIQAYCLMWNSHTVLSLLLIGQSRPGDASFPQQWTHNQEVLSPALMQSFMLKLVWSQLANKVPKPFLYQWLTAGSNNTLDWWNFWPSCHSCLSPPRSSLVSHLISLDDVGKATAQKAALLFIPLSPGSVWIGRRNRCGIRREWGTGGDPH